ncbi:MAG: ferredoxin [Cytophagaceae bacterium]|nr:ferredoxin [Cytophagaceae bacterium]
MKRSILLLAFLLVCLSAKAHYMWLEVPTSARVNTQQTVKVFMGEYTYGVIEEVAGETFQSAKKFTLWAVSPAGKKSRLSIEQKENHFTAAFTPKEEGTYTFFLNNNEIDVIDYTQYDFGIFKTHYHAVAQMNVGDKVGATTIHNPEGITVKSLSTDANKIKLQVFYKGEPLANHETKTYISDQWAKESWTNEEGIIETTLPWPGEKYIVEVTKKEEVPGRYNGEDYEFIWHCVTYTKP